MGRDARDAAAAFNSPACAMAEADDIYMGYAGRDELLAALNDLLEASRAGARAALATVPNAPGGPAVSLMQAIQEDETEACAMLLGHIRTLDGAPSPRIGATYSKAMLLRDPAERIDFLNRERGQTVCKLRKLLPRVREVTLHADLAHHLRALEDHLERGKESFGRERGLRRSGKLRF